MNPVDQPLNYSHPRFRKKAETGKINIEKKKKPNRQKESKAKARTFGHITTQEPQEKPPGKLKKTWDC